MLKNIATLVVRKTSFDKGIYQVIKNRYGDELYISSIQLVMKLNDSNEKVVVMKGEKIIHKNFNWESREVKRRNNIGL